MKITNNTGDQGGGGCRTDFFHRGYDPNPAVTPDVTDPDHSVLGRSQELPDSSHGISLAIPSEVPI